MNKSIIQKIKKLLALSKSANEHEAALALQRAQALMEKHEVSELDIELSDIKEKAAKAGTQNNLPHWKSGLAHVIADAFGVRWFQQWGLKGAEVVFVGIDAYAEISSYAFTVLNRQLVKARRDYYIGLSKRFKQANRTRKADLFALAFVHALQMKVAKFAASVKTEEIIETYLSEHHPELTTFKPKRHKFKNQDNDAAIAGHKAAKGVVLNHGMRESDKPRAIA